MNIVAIHGIEHKGSTYHISQILKEKLAENTLEYREFFLPGDMNHFCRGCAACITKGKEHCPAYELLVPIVDAMDKADLLIFTTPVYVYHTTGQMKAFLDHFGYAWMVHRPNPLMFHKAAVIISTAAGAGMKWAMKDIVDSVEFWGIPQIFRYGKAVRAIQWSGVSKKCKQRIERDMVKLAGKVQKKCGKSSLKNRIKFHMMRMLNQKMPLQEIDRVHWEKQGWLEKVRPWKRSDRND